MEHLFAWLDDPLVKYLLLMAGGYALKRWPVFFNKAIPLATGIASLVIAILNTAFPTPDPTIMPALFQTVGWDGVVAAAGTPWWKSLLLDAVLPWLLAVGTHSAAKNTAELAKGGGR